MASFGPKKHFRENMVLDCVDGLHRRMRRFSFMALCMERKIYPSLGGERTEVYQ
jgi:hypothetical protein